MRHLLRQDKTPLAGEIFPLAGGDSLRWSILRSDIPFLLGTWGEQTIRACIDEIAAVKIGGSANPDVIPHFRRVIDDAAGAANHAGADIDIVIGAVCVVDEDGAAARQLAKREVALYLPIVADLDPTVTLEPALVARLKAAAAAYDFVAAAALVSDELLAKFAFAGTPDQVAAHAASLFAAGAQRVEFGTPHGLTPEEGMRLLGTRVLPALR
ncbi:MAG: LLM class flavin-dependent oxidoreductase [Caldilineaceae bacterium]